MDWLIAALVFVIALAFSMLGLGGGMLYVPLFKWLELPLKSVAIPLSLLLNGVTTLSAFLRYWREGLVDFRGGLPAAVGAWSMACVPRDALLVAAHYLFMATDLTLCFRSRAITEGKFELGLSQ